MLAAVYHGPDNLLLEERPVPSIGPDEALLKVVSAGICGTDLRILHGGHRLYPAGTVRVPGHEIVGNIAQLGTNVKGLGIGQRVFVAPNVGCGHCQQCVNGNNNRCANYEAFGITLDGGFAEYMRITAPALSQGNILPLSKQVDPAVAALAEPFACVLRGQDAVGIRSGDIVVIIGTGPIGIMHLLLAHFSGASRVIVSGQTPERLAYARQFGADRVVNTRNEELAEVVAEESDGQGADVILVATPSPQDQENALRLAAIGGRINFFGGLPKDSPTIRFDSNAVHYKELCVTGTTACSTADCRRAIAIIGSGRVDLSGLISTRYPLAEVKNAFTAAEDRRNLKVVLQPEC